MRQIMKGNKLKLFDTETLNSARNEEEISSSSLKTRLILKTGLYCVSFSELTN